VGNYFIETLYFRGLIENMKLDVLAIGVHPDDVELSCSGTILVELKRGKKVGILDLTQGELGTRGTIETRYAEAANAAKIMGVQVRENLKMRDGFFRNDEEHQMKLISYIRKYQPGIILANALHDRHPDHGRAGQLIATAAYLSGLRKIETVDEKDAPQQHWRPRYVLHYLQDWYHEPQFIIDISDVFDQRMKAIEAYSTQFYNPANSSEGAQTYISSPDFLDSVIARASMLGKKRGIKLGEGSTSEKQIRIKYLDALVQIET